MGALRRDAPVAIIGAGRVARAFAPALADAGVPLVAVFARRPGMARRVASSLPGVVATTRLEAAVAPARIVLLAVPDRALATVARDLAALPGVDWSGRVVLHHAGSLGPAPLAPLRRAGAAVGVLHPLQCLGDSPQASALLAGSRARIEGDARARAVAAALARRLGLVPLPRVSWTAASREGYHAAASLAANDLVALLADAVALCRRAGLDERTAIEALVPLLRGTLALAESDGIGAALSGPAVRGDLATLRRHRRRVAAISPDTARAHALLSRRLRELARRVRARPRRR